MKRTLLASATLLALSSTAALAQSYSYSASPRTYQEMAQTLSATPIVERVSTPRQQCWNEQVAVNDDRRVRRHDGYARDSGGGGSGAGAVLGAIIGGVLGHQMGNSSGGRDRGTAAGAVLGGVIGNGIESSGNRDGGYDRAEYDRGAPVVRQVQRCNTVNDAQEKIVGYDVRYRLHGRDYTTRMASDPGPSFPVNVEVRPYGHGRSGYSQPPAPSYSRY